MIIYLEMGNLFSTHTLAVYHFTRTIAGHEHQHEVSILCRREDMG